MQHYRTIIDFTDEKVSFIFADRKKKIGGKKREGTLEKGCNFIGFLFFFIITFTLSTGYFYLLYDSGKMIWNGTTLLFGLFFIFSMIILYVMASGKREPSYHFGIEINKLNQLVTVKDHLKNHFYTISFAELSHFEVLKFKGTRKSANSTSRRGGHEILYLVLKNDSTILLTKQHANWHQYLFTKKKLGQLLSYVNLPVKLPSNYKTEVPLIDNTAKFTYRKRQHSEIKMPRFKLFSSDGVEGIKFMANRTATNLITRSFVVLFFAP